MNDKTHKCETCDSAFARAHDLKRHRRLHEGAKPFVCQHCTRAFSRQDALSRHLKTDNPAFPCCGLNTRRSVSSNYRSGRSSIAAGVSIMAVPSVAQVGETSRMSIQSDQGGVISSSLLLSPDRDLSPQSPSLPSGPASAPLPQHQNGRFLGRGGFLIPAQTESRKPSLQPQSSSGISTTPLSQTNSPISPYTRDQINSHQLVFVPMPNFPHPHQHNIQKPSSPSNLYTPQRFLSLEQDLNREKAITISLASKVKELEIEKDLLLKLLSSHPAGSRGGSGRDGGGGRNSKAKRDNNMDEST